MHVCIKTLALGCAGIFYILIQPTSFMSPYGELSCAHTSFCLQQKCFEFCPEFHCICQDFISIGRRFNFDSQHTRLEDYLDKKQRCLSFSKLPHFWLECICACFQAAYQSSCRPTVAKLQSNLLTRDHLHIRNKLAQAPSKTNKQTKNVYSTTSQTLCFRVITWRVQP